MKILLFLGSSTLFHAVTFGTIVLGNHSFHFPQTSVQKGSGSIEVQIVILGQQGKPDRGVIKSIEKKSKQSSEVRDSLKEFLKPQEGNSKASFPHKPEIRLEEEYSSKELETEIQTLKGWFPESLVEQNQKNIKSSIEKKRVMPLIIPAPKDSGALQKNSFNILGNPPPRYPKMAILKGWEGETVVRVSVNAFGEIQSLEMIQSSGFTTLDEAVLKILPRWHFEKGKARVMDIPFKFALRTEK